MKERGMSNTPICCLGNRLYSLLHHTTLLLVTPLLGRWAPQSRTSTDVFSGFSVGKSAQVCKTTFFLHFISLCQGPGGADTSTYKHALATVQLWSTYGVMAAVDRKHTHSLVETKEQWAVAACPFGLSTLFYISRRTDSICLVANYHQYADSAWQGCHNKDSHTIDRKLHVLPVWA